MDSKIEICSDSPDFGDEIETKMLTHGAVFDDILDDLYYPGYSQDLKDESPAMYSYQFMAYLEVFE
jgi:hypothetical protein